jgi:hypothetical protein
MSSVRSYEYRLVCRDGRNLDTDGYSNRSFIHDRPGRKHDRSAHANDVPPEQHISYLSLLLLFSFLTNILDPPSSYSDISDLFFFYLKLGFLI